MKKSSRSNLSNADRDERANATSTLSENEESVAVRTAQTGSSQPARRRPVAGGQQAPANTGGHQADVHHQHLEELEQQQQEEEESK